MPYFNIVLFTVATKALPNEGLVVLLADLVRGLLSLNVPVRLLMSDRHRESFLIALEANGVRRDSVLTATFSVTPPILRILLRGRARVRRRPIKFFQHISWIESWAIGAIATSNWYVLVLLLIAGTSMLIAAGAISMVLAACFLVVWIILKLAARLRKKNLRGWNPKFKRWLIRTKRRMVIAAVEIEATRLALKINELPDAKAVFLPFCFVGELARNLVAKKLIVFPDVVPAVYPTRFIGAFTTEDFEAVRVTVSSADALVCYSGAVADGQMRRFFAAEIGSKPVYVIPQGFFHSDDLNVKSPKSILFKNHFTNYVSFLPKYNLQDIRYVVYPSVDRPHKNLITIVRAVEYLVRNRHLNLKVICTSHSVSEEVKDFVKRKRFFLDVLFAPSLDGEELNYLIENSTAVIHSSLAEGGDIFNFSRGVAAGIPVLLSDISMTREMFERYDITRSAYEDWLFNPKDYRQLASKIEEVLSDSDRYLKPQAMTLSLLGGYSFARMASRYLEVYRELPGEVSSLKMRSD